MIATEHMAALKVRKSVICYYIISFSQLWSIEARVYNSKSVAISGEYV